MLSVEPSPVVRAGSPSRGGDVKVYVFDTHTNLACPLLFFFFPFFFLFSVLVSISVFVALSAVFHFINSPDNSPISHSALPVLFLPHRSLQLYVSL